MNRSHTWWTFTRADPPAHANVRRVGSGARRDGRSRRPQRGRRVGRADRWRFGQRLLHCPGRAGLGAVLPRRRRGDRRCRRHHRRRHRVRRAQAARAAPRCGVARADPPPRRSARCQGTRRRHRRPGRARDRMARRHAAQVRGHPGRDPRPGRRAVDADRHRRWRGGRRAPPRAGGRSCGRRAPGLQHRHAQVAPQHARRDRAGAGRREHPGLHRRARARRRRDRTHDRGVDRS